MNRKSTLSIPEPIGTTGSQLDQSLVAPSRSERKPPELTLAGCGYTPPQRQ